MPCVVKRWNMGFWSAKLKKGRKQALLLGKEAKLFYYLEVAPAGAGGEVAAVDRNPLGRLRRCRCGSTGTSDRRPRQGGFMLGCHGHQQLVVVAAGQAGRQPVRPGGPCGRRQRHGEQRRSRRRCRRRGRDGRDPAPAHPTHPSPPPPARPGTPAWRAGQAIAVEQIAARDRQAARSPPPGPARHRRSCRSPTRRRRAAPRRAAPRYPAATVPRIASATGTADPVSTSCRRPAGQCRTWPGPPPDRRQSRRTRHRRCAPRRRNRHQVAQRHARPWPRDRTD